MKLPQNCTQQWASVLTVFPVGSVNTWSVSQSVCQCAPLRDETQTSVANFICLLSVGSNRVDACTAPYICLFFLCQALFGSYEDAWFSCQSVSKLTCSGSPAFVCFV